jgi:hypothetical protein
MQVRATCFVLATLFAFVAAGCGSSGEMPLGRVSGTVTLNNQPVTSGAIYFVPQKGPGASGTLDAQGRFVLTTYSSGDGAVLGPHTIYFAPLTDGTHLDNYSEADYIANKPPPAAPTQEFLPAMYLSPSSSKLTREVLAGRNTLELSL